MKDKYQVGPLKRVCTINDFSGFGKCSLTVSIPILSVAGIEVCAMPTAVLSTHTGEFEHYTYRDLTEDLPAYMEHWLSLNIQFAGIYTGYLGSTQQSEMVLQYIHKAKTLQTLIFIDPVMGDHGKLYQNFNEDRVNEMKKLCQNADFIFPNMTEATALAGISYQGNGYDESYIQQIFDGLQKFNVQHIILTGVENDKNQIGVVAIDREIKEKIMFFEHQTPGNFHGTGDVFASFFIAGILNALNFKRSLKMALELTNEAVRRTWARQTPLREGLDFEHVLPNLISKIKDQNE